MSPPSTARTKTVKLLVLDGLDQLPWATYMCVLHVWCEAGLYEAAQEACAHRVLLHALLLWLLLPPALPLRMLSCSRAPSGVSSSS